MMTRLPVEMTSGPTIHFQSGDSLFQHGDPCTQFVYIVSGTVRVDLLSETGKNVLLYRLSANSTCVLTTACLFGENDYSAQATAESDVSVLLLDKLTFNRLIADSADFRGLVFSSFSDRLTKMLEKMDEVSFSPIEKRLALALLQRSNGIAEIAVTHDQLAADIGSAREVITRQLALFESKGIIERKRGALIIGDVAELTRLAEK